VLDDNGNLFVAYYGSGLIKEFMAVNGTIPASPTINILASGFKTADGIAVDHLGNVFVSEFLGSVNEILAVNGAIPPSPKVVTFTTNFLGPRGLALDAAGDLYVADSGNNVIEKMLAVSGSIPSAPVIVPIAVDVGYSPLGLARDNAGDLYVSGTAAYELIAVDGPIPSTPTTFKLVDGLDNAMGIALDVKGNTYIADTFNNRLLMVSLSGANLGSISVGTTGAAIPLNFTFDIAGTLGSVSVLTQGAPGLDFTNAGSGTCSPNAAYSAGQTCTVEVTFAPTLVGARYGAVILEDTNGHAFATGYLQGIGVGAQLSFLPGTERVINGASLSNPHGIAVDGSGNIYVSDDNGVEKETYSNGSYTQTTIASGFTAPNLLAVDGAGNLYITELNKAVWKETPTGSGYTQSVVDSGFGYYGVAVDGAGDVYIVDAWNGQILKETPSVGGYTPATVVSGLSNPVAVAVDAAGNLYIAEDSVNATGTLLK
jgi:sugar lactone lactonase YvrE